MKLFRLIALYVLVSCCLGSAAAQTGALPDEAAENLRQAQRLAAQALNTYPQHFADQPLWNQAIQYGNRARQLAPEHPAPLRFLAQTYTITGWYSRAWDSWAAYREAGGTMDAQARLQLTEAGMWLGYNSYNAGNLAAAERYYRTVYDLDDTNDNALQWLARVTFEQGKPETALAYWQELARRRPTDEYYAYMLERIQSQLEHGVEASNAYYRGLEAEEAGRLAEAFEHYQDAVSAEPQFLDALRQAGAVSLELERPRLARDYWARVLTLVPSDAGAAFFLNLAEDQLQWGIEASTAFRDGVEYYQAGDLDAAEASLADATELNPDYAEAWAWRGRLAFEAEDYAAAQEYFEEAAELEPGTQSYRYFAQESARRLGTESSLAQAPAPPLEPVPQPEPQPEPALEPEPTPAPPEPEPPAPESPAPQAAEAPQAEPAQEERLQQAPTPPALQEAQDAEAAQTTPEPEPEPAESGPQLLLLDVSYTHQSNSQAGGGAFAFFALPDALPDDLSEPVNYAGGTLYQKLEVISKPSSEPVQYQLCLISDDINVRPACSSKGGLSFREPGVYEHVQSLTTFDGFDNVDWSAGLREAMLIVNSGEGLPVDQRYATAGQPALDPSLYYPMELRYSAVLVPEGGTFTGWP